NDENNKNYVVYAYNYFCNFSVPCENIFKEFMDKYKIDFLSINIDEFKKTKLYETVKYVPTVIVVKNGKPVAYLDAESDDDLNKYQDADAFESWIKEYIDIK
ncbi:MAG: thioredoxin family protein, partial [Bacilli bacterium]|nr:thioredoxin family protein [Bacilli bacterium]